MHRAGQPAGPRSGSTMDTGCDTVDARSHRPNTVNRSDVHVWPVRLRSSASTTGTVSSGSVDETVQLLACCAHNVQPRIAGPAAVDDTASVWHRQQAAGQGRHEGRRGAKRGANRRGKEGAVCGWLWLFVLVAVGVGGVQGSHNPSVAGSSPARPHLRFTLLILTPWHQSWCKSPVPSHDPRRTVPAPAPVGRSRAAGLLPETVRAVRWGFGWRSGEGPAGQ
jgi:hypothetical protein